MKQGEGKQRKSVILAAGAGGYSAMTLDLAVRLAVTTRRRLRGVFVEDEDLLQLTGLPFAREVSLTTAEVLPLDTVRLQRNLRVVANRFRRALERESLRLESGWSFDTVRGRLRDVGLQSGREAACIVLAPAGERPRAAAHRSSRRILVVAGPSRRRAYALDSALASFSEHAVEVTLVEPTGQDPDARARIAAATDRNAPLSVVAVSPQALPALLRTRGAAFDCAIVALREAPELLQTLLENLRCPVVLLA